MFNCIKSKFCIRPEIKEIEKYIDKFKYDGVVFGGHHSYSLRDSKLRVILSGKGAVSLKVDYIEIELTDKETKFLCKLFYELEKKKQKQREDEAIKVISESMSSLKDL